MSTLSLRFYLVFLLGSLAGCFGPSAPFVASSKSDGTTACITVSSVDGRERTEDCFNGHAGAGCGAHGELIAVVVANDMMGKRRFRLGRWWQTSPNAGAGTKVRFVGGDAEQLDRLLGGGAVQGSSRFKRIEPYEVVLEAGDGTDRFLLVQWEEKDPNSEGAQAMYESGRPRALIHMRGDDLTTATSLPLPEPHRRDAFGKFTTPIALWWSAAPDDNLLVVFAGQTAIPSFGEHDIDPPLRHPTAFVVHRSPDGWKLSSVVMLPSAAGREQAVRSYCGHGRAPLIRDESGAKWNISIVDGLPVFAAVPSAIPVTATFHDALQIMKQGTCVLIEVWDEEEEVFTRVSGAEPTSLGKQTGLEGLAICP